MKEKDLRIKFFKANSGYIFSPKKGCIDLDCKFSFSKNPYILAQQKTFKLIKEYEDTLKIIADKIMFSKIEEDRIRANDGFMTILKDVLSYEKSYKYPFDSLETISILSPADKNFKLFNKAKLSFGAMPIISCSCLSILSVD